MPFDPLKDLVPVHTVATNQFVLAINPSIPAKTYPEFVEYAKKANPPLAYASGGNGSQHHHDDGDAEAPRRRPAPRWRAGSVPCCIRSCRRSASSIRDSRTASGLPSSARPDCRSRCSLEQTDLKQRFNSAGGLEPFVTTADELNALIKRDHEKYGRVVKEVGIKLD